jgi:hypothetical protein
MHTDFVILKAHYRYMSDSTVFTRRRCRELTAEHIGVRYGVRLTHPVDKWFLPVAYGRIGDARREVNQRAGFFGRVECPVG